MIAPLLQGPLPPVGTPGRESESSELGRGGFPEILAAAGATAKPNLLEPRPAPDHGPARVAVSPGLSPEIPGRAVTDPASSLSPASEGGPAAERFNQSGFFASTPYRGEVEAPNRAKGEFPSVERPESVALTEDRASAAASLQHADSPMRFESAKAHQTPASTAYVAARPAAATATVAQPAARIRPDAPEAAAAASRRLPLREPAARAPIQVVLRELAQGIQVAARLEALRAGEGEAMRDEILALLSRHGLRAHGVRVVGPASSTPTQEEET